MLPRGCKTSVLRKLLIYWHLWEVSLVKWRFRGRLLSMSDEYFLGRRGLKLRTFSADGRRTLLCKNRGSSNFCARLIEWRNLREPLHPSGEIYKFFEQCGWEKTSPQACWLRGCFHQLTNLVLVEWCPSCTRCCCQVVADNLWPSKTGCQRYSFLLDGDSWIPCNRKLDNVRCLLPARLD